jgi:hypothetical protein
MDLTTADNPLQQLITHAAHGLEQRRAGPRVELGAQPAHVHVEQIRLVAMVGRAALLAYQLASEYASDVLHEELQQGELPVGELDRLAGEVHRVSDEIELDAAVLQDRLFDGRLTPQQRAHARQKLLQAEGLGQVIIGTEIEPVDPILYGIARAQNQYRLVEAGLAPLLQQIQSIAIRQSQIENDRVIIRTAQRIVCSGARLHPRYRVGALPQRIFQERAYAALVFDDKDFRDGRLCCLDVARR